MTERRLLGHMVTRNERDRYLDWSLMSLKTACDAVFVFDDNSDDGTFEYLKGLAITQVRSRNRSAPAFVDDESAFRSAGWRAMQEELAPGPDDWVLCLDADEVLVASDGQGLRAALDRVIDGAQQRDIAAVCFGVEEVFDIREGQPWVRTDGFWGGIQACRLVRSRPHPDFDPRRLAGGSVPTSWIDWRLVAENLRILHFGYARHEDRLARYHRYRSREGHAGSHIESILTVPELTPWTGDVAWMHL